jgi:uncharacterized protein (UPF0147 family)
MPRKPSATLQYKLRIRESLRRRIEAAAKPRGVSANYEMVSRLEASFAADVARSIDIIADDIEKNWSRGFGAALHELNKQGDLLRVVEPLLKLIEDDADVSKRIRAAAEKVKPVIEMINTEAARMARKAHTTAGAVDG